MGWACFDREGKNVADVEPHLFSATGFLDDTWWHRTYWQYGVWFRGGFGGFFCRLMFASSKSTYS